MFHLINSQNLHLMNQLLNQEDRLLFHIQNQMIPLRNDHMDHHHFEEYINHCHHFIVLHWPTLLASLTVLVTFLCCRFNNQLLFKLPNEHKQLMNQHWYWHYMVEISDRWKLKFFFVAIKFLHYKDFECLWPLKMALQKEC